MTRRVYASTSCVRGQYASVEAQIEDYLAHGISDIELGWTAPASSADLCAHLCAQPGRFLIHNYFPRPSEAFVLNLASQSVQTLKRSKELCVAALRLSAALGAPFYSVHAGFRGVFTPDSLGKVLERDEIASREAALETFHRSVVELSTLARSLGVRLLIEPNVVEHHNLVSGHNELLLLADAGEILEFFLAHDDGTVGLLLDTGHLNVSANTLGFGREQFIERTAAHISAFHVHDNDGTADQHRSVTAGSWVLETLSAPSFCTAPVIIESEFRSAEELGAYLRWFSREIAE